MTVTSKVAVPVESVVEVKWTTPALSRVGPELKVRPWVAYCALSSKMTPTNQFFFFHSRATPNASRLFLGVSSLLSVPMLIEPDSAIVAANKAARPELSSRSACLISDLVNVLPIK